MNMNSQFYIDSFDDYEFLLAIIVNDISINIIFEMIFNHLYKRIIFKIIYIVKWKNFNWIIIREININDNNKEDFKDFKIDFIWLKIIRYRKFIDIFEW